MPNPENEGYQRLGEGLYHLRAAAGGGGELFWGLDPRNPRKRPKFWADVTSISPNMAIFESPKIDGLGIGPLQALSGVLPSQACRYCGYELLVSGGCIDADCTFSEIN